MQTGPGNAGSVADMEHYAAALHDPPQPDASPIQAGASFQAINPEHLQAVAEEAASIHSSMLRLQSYAQLVHSNETADSGMKEAAQEAAILLQGKPIWECLLEQRAAYQAWQEQYARVNASGELHPDYTSLQCIASCHLCVWQRKKLCC